MRANMSVPKWIELGFDGVYLISATILGVYMIIYSQENIKQIWGTMALVLAIGDSFHLIPRMAAAYTKNPIRFKSSMGLGKLITSITMTIFYIILWHCGLKLFSLELTAHTIAVYILACIRIAICLLPQNKWRSGDADNSINIYRNIPFLLQGILVMWLFAKYSGNFPALQFMWVAILISFICYMPVAIWSFRYPKLGMLMLPKTCAYLWIICIGFWI